LFLLNHDCCTSIDKCKRFLYDLTEGKLSISKGMISRLSREFAKKSEKEMYEYIPPDKYYRDGYNLYRRMDHFYDCQNRVMTI